MTVASTVVFLMGFFIACLLGLVACRLVWVRAVRLTRARLERDRPETLRAFEARIAGAQARAAISIRELERALERERQISAQARLMADQMSSSSALAFAERDDTQSSLVNLSDTLNQTRERLREHEEMLARKNGEMNDIRHELSVAQQELVMRDDDVQRLTSEAAELRQELAAQLAGESDADTVANLADSGDAAAMARAQIENLRETVRQLRGEKNAAEASAARARLLLDAKDDSQAMAAARADFDAQKRQMTQRIEDLEENLRKAQRAAGPQLVSINGVEPEDVPAAATPEVTPASASDLESLRASIDAMTASLTATTAIELDAHDRINALLDEAEQDGVDSNLVTSLVEARERLRSRKPAPAKKSAKKPAARTRKRAEKSDGAEAKKQSAKISAATVSGEPSEKASSMPRASENDLKVI